MLKACTYKLDEATIRTIDKLAASYGSKGKVITEAVRLLASPEAISEAIAQAKRLPMTLDTLTAPQTPAPDVRDTVIEYD